MRWRRLDPGQRLVIAGLVWSALGSLAGGHLSWHYFIQVMGPLALLAAFAVDSALRTPLRKRVAVIVAIRIAVPALACGAYDVAGNPVTYYWYPTIPHNDLLALY